MNYIEEYVNEIKAGRIVTSRRVLTVYSNLLNDMNDPLYYFDEESAKRPIEFIERFCRHSKGELYGQLIELELFQKAYISALFGFRERETGLRRFRESMFLIGRKNGKSTLMGGLGLYMMLADHEPGAEVYSVATKKDQANILFDSALQMVKASPELRRMVKKRRTDLYCEKNNSKFEPLGRNSNSLDGLNAHMVIADEMHAWTDRNLYEVLKQSQSARREPLMIMITTSGDIRGKVFDDLYSYACNVADGTFYDPTFLPILYELDDKDEWKDPNMWIKANPGLGTIKKVKDLEDKVNRAKQDDSSLKGLLCKDFNIRVTGANAWLEYEDIVNEEMFSLSNFSGGYCLIGCDLSEIQDLSCVSFLVWDRTGKTYVHQMYWLPSEMVSEKIEKDRIPYDIWIQNGYVRTCNGKRIVQSDITAYIVETVQKYNLSMLGFYYDPWSASYLVEDMKRKGFSEKNMYMTRQGAKTLSVPMKELKADLQDKRMIYNSNPVLMWCLSNVAVVSDDNENIRPTKARSKQRIDGVASLLNAYVGFVNRKEELLRLAVI